MLFSSPNGECSTTTCNMNPTDRWTRFIAGAILTIISPLGLSILPSGVIGWFCAVFGIINMISAVAGWCFMYSLVGLTSRDVNTEDSEQLIDIDYRVLRARVLIGFGVVALLVNGLFLLESYSAAKDAVKRMELKQIQEIANIITHEITQDLIEHHTSIEQATTYFDKALLAEMLQDTDDSVFVGIYDQRSFVSVGKLMTEQVEQQLEHFVKNDILSWLKNYQFKNKLEHEQVFEGDNKDLDAFFYDVGDVQYGLSYKLVSNTELGPVWLVFFKLSETTDLVIAKVFFRLIASSMIVMWLALWGAVGVSYFTWRYVEHSNRVSLKAARMDSVTGLHNERALREYFLEHINTSLVSYQVSVVQFRNLPHIIETNSSEVVSRILAQLGQTFKNSLKADCVLARLNDGKLMMVAPRESTECFDMFRVKINENQLVDDFIFSLDPTEAIISYPEDVNNFDMLLSTASMLLYSANKARLPQVHYDEAIIRTRSKEPEYAAGIREAIEEQQFELYLQPKVNVITGDIIGAEALIRWNHPRDGILSPYYFLDIVERSNMRSAFACYVISQVANIQKKLLLLDYKLTISFNLNGYDVLDPEVHSALKTLSRSSDFCQGGLEVELTESETTIQVDRIVEGLASISQLGYHIALDDFGTGMSSFSFSHRLPISTIKIDKSFVDQITLEPHSQIPIKAIIYLAENYGYQVITEGVESEEQLEILSKLGCQICQGYYFAKPMPFGQFVECLNKQDNS
ncbi:EAL domain-containing protein [Thalassotalea sp. G2M2-11]|uniref:EAL domain-containing protein n=1 Tax=Thalassotalea sp. G2M2-11 TaxID=2787627 RepID=UPI0019D24446|nr:EAL domain-containing protein [Thalassotalea sp. G2M2-11]